MEFALKTCDSHSQEKDTESAIATLKAFERLDHKLNCSAAINLSFLYFHERDYLQAAKYVDVAIEADRFTMRDFVFMQQSMLTLQ